MVSKVNLPYHFQNWNNSRNPSIAAASLSSGPSPDFESPKPQTSIYKRRWFIASAAFVGAAIVILLVVPLAVILPRKSKEVYHASVMLPLYIYPENNDTWAPLYRSLSAHPGLNFTVIINPSSGPGSPQGPNEQYTAALHQLNTFSNVQKVGYVRTNYGLRNLSDVISEVNTYSGWASKSPDFTLDGIFFDESPHQFTQVAVDFMNNATQAVKAANGLQGRKIVIRNPGVVPDAAFDDANTDVTVIFEQSYDEYLVKVSDLSTMSKDTRVRSCYMVHSLPAMDKNQMRNLVGKMSVRAKYLFVTNNKENYYEKFGTDWVDFTDTITA